MHVILVWLASVLLLALVWALLPFFVVLALIPVGAGLAGVDAVRRHRQLLRWQATIPADNAFWNGGLPRPRPPARDTAVDELLEEDR